MTPEHRLVELLSYYRDAELRGAALLMRLLKMTASDPDAQVALTRHVADETRHAWLWTKRIRERGGAPVVVVDGYQARMGVHVRPRSLVELLALTIVAEERSLVRYSEHLSRQDVDDATRSILRQVVADEAWHGASVRGMLERAIGRDPTLRQRVRVVMGRYRRVDADVHAALLARERRPLGVPLTSLEPEGGEARAPGGRGQPS